MQATRFSLGNVLHTLFKATLAAPHVFCIIVAVFYLCGTLSCNTNEIVAFLSCWFALLLAYEMYMVHTCFSEPIQQSTLFSIATIITIARIIAAYACVPLLVASIKLTTHNVSAALLYTAICMTDFFDGWVARARGCKTLIGTLIDPFADKILLMVTSTHLVFLEKISPAVWYVLLFRELFVMYLRIYAISRGQIITVSKLAKIKTALQLVTLTLILYAPQGVMLKQIEAIALLSMVCVTIVSGLEYVYGVLWNLLPSQKLFSTLKHSQKELK